MPVARFRTPDGRIARFRVPEGTSPEQAQMLASSYFSKLSAPPVAEAPAPKFGDPGVGDSDVPGYTPLPEEMPQAAPEQNLWQKARPYVAPTVEMLGAAGGGLAGGFLGAAGGGIGAIPGSAVGAGLGNAGAKKLMTLADIYLGGEAAPGWKEAATSSARDILEGAAYELGGQVAAPIIAKGVAKTVGTLKDLSPSRRAAVNILRESTEGKDQQVRNALKAGRVGELPAETLARESVNVPVTQNLLKDVKSGAPTHFSDIGLAKETKHLDDLVEIAKGSSQVESLESQKLAKETLRNVTEPERKQILKSVADTSNTLVDLEEQVIKNRLAASQSVDDVRRFASAEQKAIERSKQVFQPSGMPRVPGRYTHMGELATLADEAMDKAARGSLDYGKAARFAQSQLDELTEAGLKPLKAEDLIRKVSALKTKHHAGNDLIEGTIDDFIQGVQKWTNEKGIIDPWALDALRKNAVNSTIGRLRPGFDAKAMNNASAGVLSDITPLIDDAFDAAGGTGYKAYRESFRKGMNEISNTKMGAKLLDLYKSGNHDKFIKILNNDAPKDVEKILGPGRNNIAEELGKKEYTKLRKIADDLKVTKEIERQVSDESAEDAMHRIVKEHSKKFKVPDMLNVIATTSNKVLGVVEGKVNKKTFKLLTEAAKDSKTFGELLDNVPSVERSELLKIMADPETFSKLIPKGLSAGVGVTGKNALSEKREKRNALSR